MQMRQNNIRHRPAGLLKRRGELVLEMINLFLFVFPFSPAADVDKDEAIGGLEDEHPRRELDAVLRVGRDALLPKRLRHGAEHRPAVEAEAVDDEREDFVRSDLHSLAASILTWQSSSNSPGIFSQPAMLRLTKFLATGFYSGYLPKVPGTWGTAVAALLAFAYVSAKPERSSLECSIFAAGVVTIIAILSAHHVWQSRIYGEGAKDPQQIVIDEFAGYFVSIIGAEPRVWSFLLAFGFFRVFDIWKPYPCRRLEHLSGGYGIVMDDVMAGVYACICVNVCETLLF